MGNAGVIPVTSLVDIKADQYIATFQTLEIDTDDGTEEIIIAPRHVDKIQVQAGIEPSYATVSIDSFGFPNHEGSVPFNIAMKSAGPAGRVRMNMRGTISVKTSKGKTIPILVGTVVDISHSVSDDSVVLTIVDDKWLLSKFTTFGQVQFDPTESGGVVGFNATAPLIFNQNGYPNCLDTASGPVFAPFSRFGYKMEQTKEPERPSTNIARSWLVEDAILYLRNLHTGLLPNSNAFVNYGQTVLPINSIIWPEGAGSGLGDRPLHHFDIEGDTLLGALDKLAKSSKHFELYFAPTANGGNNAENAGGAVKGGKGVLNFINMTPSVLGTFIFVGGLQKTPSLSESVKSNSPSGGFLTESIREFYNEAVILGDGPVIERMCSMEDTTLEAAWSDEDEEKFKKYIEDNSSSEKTALLAFQEASYLYPLVYVAFRIPVEFDYLEGTKWENGDRVRKHPRIMPTLITGVNFNNDTSPRDWMPRQITIEAKNKANAFVIVTKYDGLQVSTDGGYFLIGNLRDVGDASQAGDGTEFVPNHPTWRGTITQPLLIVRNEIRCTLAIQADFRISGNAGENDDPNSTGARIYNGHDQLTSYTIPTAPLDYVDWLRIDSSPMGLTVPLPKGFPDAKNPKKDGLLIDRKDGKDELFSDRSGSAGAVTGRIFDHAANRLLDVKKIEGGGQLRFLQFHPGLTPGAVVDSIFGSDIDYRRVVRSYTIDANTQSMIVNLD